MVVVEEVLSELGWDDGFHIPIANEENKRLEEEIARKTKYRTSLNFKLEAVDERITAIKKHATNIALEHDHNQKLLSAHSMQLDSEEHLYRLSNSTNSKICQETRQFDKELKDVCERISHREAELSKLIDKLEALKKTAKFDKDQLVQWEEALNRGEEDSQLIEKYMKLDNKKFKELELKRQKLSVELDVNRHAIVRAVDEVYEMEIILDRTARLYSGALRERQQLIHQWTQSVLVLQQRDDDIRKTLRDIETLREVGREKMEVLQEAEQFLKDQMNNNKQLEESMKQLEKKNFLVREEHQRLVDAVATYTTEVHTEKKILEDLGHRTQHVRVKRKQKKIDIENKYRKMEEWSKQIGDLKTTLEDINNQRLNITERTKQLEEMIEKEEKHKALCIREVNRLQGMALRAVNQSTELEGGKKTLELQIQSEQKKVDLQLVYHMKEKQRLKDQKEAIYDLDFEIQKCEIKYRRMMGIEHDKEESEKKQRMIEDLQKVFNDKTEILKMLQTQIINLEYDMRKISNILANDQLELQRLRNKKQDLTLLMDGGEKQLKSIKSCNEEKQVEENILRLRVSQAEEIISNIDNKVYNLEKYRIQIKAAMQERKADIKAQKESFNIRKRLAMNDCSELRIAIAERKSRTQQLQVRYDNTLSALGNTADGTPLTTTYLKIKNAQEKYSLQEQGDKLDETIRKTEHEIQSMENTLRIVNASNEKYKMSLGIIDESGPEHMEQRKLNEEMFNVLEKIRQKRAQIEQSKADLKTMESNYAQLLDDIEKAEDDRAHKQRCLENLERQITEQKGKQLRADKSLHKVFKEIQNLCMCTEDTMILLQEKDIALRELQEQNGLALQHITEFTIRHMEAEPYVKKLLSDKNMVLPCTNYLKPSPMPSRCESSASSLSTKMAFRNRGRTSSSVCSSTQESVSHILNIEPCFDAVSTDRSSGRCTDPDVHFRKLTTRSSTSTGSRKLSRGRKK